MFPPSGLWNTGLAILFYFYFFNLWFQEEMLIRQQVAGALPDASLVF